MGYNDNSAGGNGFTNGEAEQVCVGVRCLHLWREVQAGRAALVLARGRRRSIFSMIRAPRPRGPITL